MIFRLVVCFSLAAVIVGCGLRIDNADATNQAALYAASQQQVARENRMADEERAYQRTQQEQVRQDGRFWVALIMATGICLAIGIHWNGKVRYAEVVTGVYQPQPQPPLIVEQAARHYGGLPEYDGQRWLIVDCPDGIVRKQKRIGVN